MAFQNAVTDELLAIFQKYIEGVNNEYIYRKELYENFNTEIRDFYTFMMITALTFCLQQCFGSDFRSELAKLLVLKRLDFPIATESKTDVARALLPVIDFFCNGDYSALLNNIDIRDKGMTIFPYD